MGVTIREKELANGRKSLYLDVYFQGRRSYEFLNLQLNGNRQEDKERRRLAEVVRSQREVELFSQAHGLIPEHKGKIPLFAYATEKAQGHPKKDPLVKSLPLIEKYFGEMQLKAVHSKAVEGYQTFLQSQKVRRPGAAGEATLMWSTVANYFNALNTVLNLAVKERILISNPAQGVRRVKPQETRQFYLTRDEVERLAKTPIMGEEGLGGEIRRAFLFACFTGLRLSDIKTLTWGDIRNGKIEKRMVKTKAMLTVDLNSTALALMQGDSLKPHDALVFTLTGTDPNQYLKQWGTGAGIAKPLHFHVSRHTFATMTLDEGADPFTVQNLLGHKDIKMTQNYAKATDRSKKQAVGRIEMDLSKAGKA